MNTQLQQALSAAGLAIPLNRRVWTWLKDHPEKSSRDIGVALNVTPGDTSAVLANMYHRGMVSRYERPTRNRVGSKTEYCYSALGKTFELLPLPKTPKPSTTPPMVPMITVPPATPGYTVPVEMLNAPKINIDNMKLSEARALYDQLKQVFGGK